MGVSLGRYMPVGYKPTFSPAKALQIIRQEPMVKASVRAIVDKAMQNGYTFKGTNKQELERFKRIWKEKGMESRILKTTMNMLVLENNAFVEIVGGKENFKDINVLDNTYVWIKADGNGNIWEYEQQVIDPHSGIRPKWTPDEICHIKVDNYSANLWAEMDILTLYETVVLKRFVKEFTNWLFRTNQFRSIFILPSSGQQQVVDDFLSEIKQGEEDVTRPLMLQAEDAKQVINSVLRDFSGIDQLIKLMDWCDTQIAATMGVPPASVGKMDASGRSNSDMQENDRLGTRVKALHQVVEDYYTNELFKKMGFPSVEFYFKTLNMKTVTDLLANAGLMKTTLGVKDEVIQKFLEDWGFDYSSAIKAEDDEEEKEPTIFNPMPEPLAQGQQNGLKKDESQYPSRKRANGDRQKYDKPTTRPDQLVSRSVPDFSDYPYVIGE